jgi:glycosyltransferase involved in cell wall biosynthesis
VISDFPLVSVVIPVFNGKPFLQFALDSVLQQTYPNIEIVITDGGSLDGSKEWLENYSDYDVVKGYLPIGSGAAANWTLACELSSGEYVKLLCQDDLLYPNAVSVQVGDLQDNPEARIAFARRDIIDSKGKILSYARGCQGLEVGLVSGRAALLAGYRAGTNIYGEPEAVLFERQAMLKALPWQDTEPFMLDVLFYTKVLKNYPAVVRMESVGAFRVSASSWSTRLVREHRKQFRSWQQQVRGFLGPLSLWDRTVGIVNTEKTTQIRRVAYTWLTLRNRMN